MQQALLRIATAVALLSTAVWLGGLIALGALAAPVVFSVVALPASADAMVIVFRRFDTVAMSCAAIVLGTEALRRAVRVRRGRVDVLRASASVVAAAAAVFQGIRVSPRIAALHAAGSVRGVGDGGIALSKMHDMAEGCGKAQVVLLAAVIVLHVLSLPSEAVTRRIPAALAAS